MLPGEPGALTRSMQLLEDKELSVFKSVVDSHLHEYVKNQLCYEGEFYIHTSWGVLQKNGEVCTRHNHPNSLLSGINLQLQFLSHTATARDRSVAHSDVAAAGWAGGRLGGLGQEQDPGDDELAGHRPDRARDGGPAGLRSRP